MSLELYRKMQPFLGDEEELCRRMAGQLDLWEECVSLFPGREIIEEMELSLQAEDYSALYKTVHRLKGNLANFGFDSAARKAMETLGAIKENDISRMRSWYAKLKEEYLQITERLGEADET